MLSRVLNFFTSLRLTVACLVCALVLVFVGTLAQVKLGLYTAQSEYFRNVFVYWQPAGSHWRIPVFPGGWLLGGLLLLNLLGAHAKRFEISRKKIGIFMIHGGLILLLLGQFFTEIFQVESAMRLEPDETKNYSEDFRKNEVVLIDTTDAKADKVISIPESMVAKKGEIAAAGTPLSVRVKNYWPNSDLTREEISGAVRSGATAGIGLDLFVLPRAPVTTMDERDLPSAIVEVVSSKGSLGTWLVSSLSAARQTFTYEGRNYTVGMRFRRYYVPFYITLLKFRNDLYRGTDIPKNYSSRIHLRNPVNGDDREVLIYMNNPLRYAGQTFFQAGFDEKHPGVTILQVVKNPAAPTPYISCSLMGLGLLTHFLMSLAAFFKRRKAQMKPPEGKSRKSTPARSGPEPALAGGSKNSKGRPA